jgi:hypothetical protein
LNPFAEVEIAEIPLLVSVFDKGTVLIGGIYGDEYVKHTPKCSDASLQVNPSGQGGKYIVFN